MPSERAGVFADSRKAPSAARLVVPALYALDGVLLAVLLRICRNSRADNRDNLIVVIILLLDRFNGSGCRRNGYLRFCLFGFGSLALVDCLKYGTH